MNMSTEIHTIIVVIIVITLVGGCKILKDVFAGFEK